MLSRILLQVSFVVLAELALAWKHTTGKELEAILKEGHTIGQQEGLVACKCFSQFVMMYLWDLKSLTFNVVVAVFDPSHHSLRCCANHELDM